uniref:Uncharacterized protein n=1 Tax=Oryza glumipatula TaxID=40148 RepID=A0A0D9ZYY3_9ORYZ
MAGTIYPTLPPVDRILIVASQFCSRNLLVCSPIDHRQLGGPRGGIRKRASSAVGDGRGKPEVSWATSPTTPPTTSSAKNVVPLSPSSLPFVGCDGVRGVNDEHR